MFQGNVGNGVRVPELPLNAASCPRDLIEAASELYQDRSKVDSIVGKWVQETHAATVVFFGLDGWSGYRRKYDRDGDGAKALEKVYRHNLIVSQCIERHGGLVVRWEDNGVMGFFWGEPDGKKHPYQALLAALEAIKNLGTDNQTRSQGSQADDFWREEVHTRVGMSSGPVHVLLAQSGTLAADDDSDHPVAAGNPPVVFDVLGPRADLAAQLQSLAKGDAVLTDKDTFFGLGEATKSGPVCLSSEEDIHWHHLRTTDERTTVYRPQTAAFVAQGAGVDFVETGLVHGQTVDADEFAKAADAKMGVRRLVYGSVPIDCNVAGFARAVEAVALSLHPMEAPVEEVEYVCPSSNEVKDLLDEAEGKYRQGDGEGAALLYQDVCNNDPRDFRACTRLAQFYRKKGDHQRARTYWDAAKKSNPKHPLIWALAGTAHFETFLNDFMAGDELNRAINDFARARELAARAFDGTLEQYCSCLLAISSFIRGDEPDLVKGRRIVGEIEHVLTLGPAMQVLRRLAKTFFHIAGANTRAYQDAEGTLSEAVSLLGEFEKLSQDEESTDHGADALFGEIGLSVLVDYAKLCLNRARRRRDTVAISSPDEQTGSSVDPPEDSPGKDNE